MALEADGTGSPDGWTRLCQQMWAVRPFLLTQMSGRALSNGMEAAISDNSGNWLVLVEPKEFTADDIKDLA